jgi:hypothetical protein
LDLLGFFAIDFGGTVSAQTTGQSNDTGTKALFPRLTIA